MKYEDASWHYEGKFPADLPPAAGATHIGMFAAWAVLSGLGGPRLWEDSADLLDRLRTRQITPGEFVIQACDEKLTDEDLSDEGNRFAAAYFVYDDSRANFMSDYFATIGRKGQSVYYVADTWENYDCLVPVLQNRLLEWKTNAPR